MRGLAELRESPLGYTVHRLPSWTSMYHRHDGVTQRVADHASGVTIKLVTAATKIVFTYRSTRDQNLADRIFVADHRRCQLTDRDESDNEVLLSQSDSSGDLRVWNGMELEGVTEGQNSVAVFELPEPGRQKPARDNPVVASRAAKFNESTCSAK
jgi:hypothetical protein